MTVGILTLVCCLLIVPTCSIHLFSSNDSGTVPEQIHIAYTESPSAIMVTWNTRKLVSTPVAQYWSKSQTHYRSVNATSSLFVDGGRKRRRQLIYRARLDQLLPGQQYWYRVGAADGPWSETFDFVAMRTDKNWVPRLAVYGDLGLKNPKSIPHLKDDLEKGRIDAVLHVGDFAYDMSTNDAQVGDDFMQMIQPLAARLPYMTCPGNHERHYNFSNYRARFSMPGNAENIFYSFDMGPAHFIAVSTEVYHRFRYGLHRIQTQYNWLINDLKRATLPENRAKRPWIILFGHRPMYCSNLSPYCMFRASVLRDGFPIIRKYGLEPLLARYGVDLAIWAHMHSYERLWPIFKGDVVNSSTPGQPYVDPKATVHVISGSAGNREGHTMLGPRRSFTACRSNDYGYSRLHILNSTHLSLEQVSADQDGKVIDRMLLVRHKHSPFV